MKIKRVLFACLLLPVFCLTGCSKHQELRVGADDWPGYEPLHFAREQGYFGDTPIHPVELPSAAEVMRAYRNGAIDVAALTADEVLQVEELLPGQSIILVCDFSNGADAILARPEFNSLSELRGRRIGVESSAGGAYILSRALDQARMTARDFTVVSTPLSEHVEAYASGKVDAIVTFEPYRSRIIAAGAHPVFDSSRIPREIVDVLVTRRELVEEEPEALRNLVRGWFCAVEEFRRYPAESGRKAAARRRESPEQFAGALRGIELLDRRENLELLDPKGSATNTLRATLDRIGGVMVERQILSRQPSVEGLPDDRIARRASP